MTIGINLVTHTGYIAVKTLTSVVANQRLLVTAVALAALSSLPVVEAKAGAYLACIDACRTGMGLNWTSAIVCPIICSPFLLAPG